MLKLNKTFDGPYKIDSPEDRLQSMVNDNVFTTPLIFRIDFGDHHVYSGVREFTSDSGTFNMNVQMAARLGINTEDTATVQRVDLPRGTESTSDLVTDYTKGVDLKSLLESWIPKNYTASSVNEELEIDYLGKKHRLKVTSLKPEVEAVCVLETDMDLIVNDPTLKDLTSDHIKNQRPDGQAQVSDSQDPTTIELDEPITSSKVVTGTTPAGTEFLYFTCSEIGMIGPEHATSETSFIAVSNDEEVKVSTELLGPTFAAYGRGTLTVSTTSNDPDKMSTDDDTKCCEFCGKSIPSQNYLLHTNFCARNSTRCTECGRRFGQTKEVPPSHREWHNIVNSRSVSCNTDQCHYQASSLADLGIHRATECRNKMILCRFCHLLQPQGETSMVDRAMGLTAHESLCGNRTINCYICNKRVRLRSSDVHIQDHEMQRKLQPVPAICSNNNCPNPYPQGPEGLCSSCFGPLSVPGSNTDPAKSRQRIQRRYLLQMMQGCNKPWCINQYCATNLKRTAKEAMKLTEEIMQANTHWFCVNQESTQRRMFVDYDEGTEFAKGWRASAISQCGSETEATQWLAANAN